MLAGGPPCQGFSHAGRRRSEDPRNRLFEAYLDLVAAIRPNIVLIENVKGFTSDFVSNKGEIKNFAQALKDRLDADYDTTSAILRASDFGVPQVRPRFFLIGVRRELSAAEHLGALFAQMRGRTAEFLRARKMPLAPSSRDAISDLEVAHNSTSESTETAGFRQTNYRAPRTPFQIAMRDGHSGAPSDLRLARHSPEIQERFSSIIKSANEEGRLNVSISAEVRRAHGLKKMAIRVLDPLSPAPTITSLPEDLLHYAEPRALTVRENARLQTFPDWFQFKGKYTTGGLRRRTEVPRFTQVANAVPPILAEQLGISLLNLSRSLAQAELLTDSVAELA
ncbi:DNA (cytosine-5)-methyltransferase 1 [Aminobacter aminovorans]|uniref:DNA (cytosine-5-)-methyltransferase n=2 Tax=Aminobacter aminovorans TaxID=83263 RepID=A0A380WPG9_AMIAI|nr:DNA (cytosine-5)-methyltransferase 1 [Aminobacter aminovorans]SUU90738.1 Modification methylase HaeIII [Aminobacter aminovorans]